MDHERPQRRGEAGIKTADCQIVYQAIQDLRAQMKDRDLDVEFERALQNIEDRFCDFECAWTEHQQENHP
jgi:hypothetical protein